jgi:hypothetical protein
MAKNVKYLNVVKLFKAKKKKLTWQKIVKDWFKKFNPILANKKKILRKIIIQKIWRCKCKW